MAGHTVEVAQDGTEVSPMLAAKSFDLVLMDTLPSVADLVRVVRSKLNGRGPKIVLGGSAYRLATRFAHEVGAADSFTDLRRTLAMLCA